MSEVFLDCQGNYDERSRDEFLPDYRFHQLIRDDLSDQEIDGDLELNRVEEALRKGALRDDVICFINMDYYHTPGNVRPKNASKVNAGPEGLGRAGDLDVGKLHIPTGKLTKIELKSPGRVPCREEREEMDRTFDLVKEGEEQTEYLKNLLDNIEESFNVEIPYSSRVEVWNDVVSYPVYVDEVPQYSRLGGPSGGYLCTPEARRRAEESEIVQILDEYLFKGWMFGGGENILENMD